jgi:hypothetical protein
MSRTRTTTVRRTPPGPVPSVPPLAELRLAGARRAKSGRGSAMPRVVALRVAIRSPYLAGTAATVDAQPRRGRPDEYGTPVKLVFCAFTAETGSEDVTEAELAENWDTVVRPEFWYAHGVWLPDAPLTAKTYDAWKNRAMADETRLGELVGAFEEQAYRQARDLGFLDPSRPLDWTDPAMCNVIYGDGTWIRPYSDVTLVHEVDPVDGHIDLVAKGSRARTVSAARVAPERDSDHSKPGHPYGLNHLTLSCRDDRPFSRVCLAIQVARAKQGETTVADVMLDRVAARAGDGLHVVAYDGAFGPADAMRALHHRGYAVVNRNNVATIDARTSKFATKILKPPGDKRPGVPVETRVRRTSEGVFEARVNTAKLGIFPHADGACFHELVGVDASVYEKYPHTPGLVDLRHETPIPKVVAERREHVREGVTTYSAHLELLVPCARHGAFRVVLDISLSSSGEVPMRSIAAQVRPLADTDPAYRKVYGRRNDAEALNAWIKRVMRKGRARSLDRHAQTIDLVGIALMINAETWAHRQAAADGAVLVLDPTRGEWTGKAPRVPVPTAKAA